MVTLHLSDPYFCIFLLMQFPFASDGDKEMMLDEYITEHFEMPTEQWFEELCGTASKDESVAWNGTTYVYKINEAVTLYVEFHPYETVYFFNDTYLGNTGGHFHLSLFSWNELMQMISQDSVQPSLLFLLLLPLTIGNAEEHIILQEINKQLGYSALPAEHIPAISRFLYPHLVFTDPELNVFEYKKGIGLVSARSHSERYAQRPSEDLIAINTIIAAATGHGLL